MANTYRGKYPQRIKSASTATLEDGTRVTVALANNGNRAVIGSDAIRAAGIIRLSEMIGRDISEFPALDSSLTMANSKARLAPRVARIIAIARNEWEARAAGMTLTDVAIDALHASHTGPRWELRLMALMTTQALEAHESEEVARIARKRAEWEREETFHRAGPRGTYPDGVAFTSYARVFYWPAQKAGRVQMIVSIQGAAGAEIAEIREWGFSGERADHVGALYMVREQMQRMDSKACPRSQSHQ